MNTTRVRPVFDLIIFDLDGVLADTSTCHRRAYDELWDDMGVEGPAYDAIAGRPTAEVVREVAAKLDASESRVQAWVRFKQQRALEHMRSTPIRYDDVDDSVRRLADRYTLAIGTGASRMVSPHSG